MNLIKSNLRSFSMIIALIIIWIFFTFLTDGVFLEARNLSNLFRQMAVISFLAIGMVFIIVSGNIDLSVGSVVGLTGAVAAMLQVKWLGPIFYEFMGSSNPELASNIVAIISIILTLILGISIGLFQGFWVSLGGVPAFIVTLAGMLIFRGVILGITNGITISPMEPVFKFLGQGYIPKGVGWPIGFLVSFLIIFSFINKRIKNKKYNLPVIKKRIFILLSLISVFGILFFIFIMNEYRGIPIPVILLLALSTLMAFLGKNTTFGRYIYAIGGNKEAARLSGVNISKTLLINFSIMGGLCAVGGIVLTARLDAATMNAGNMFELSAIAACVIGGCSLAGGQGSVWGALVGALVMASLDNGMSLMNIEMFWQQIVKGLVLLLAVWVDMNTKGNKKILNF